MQHARRQKFETDWTLRDNSSLSSKFEAIKVDVSDLVIPIYLRFSCLLCAVCVDCGVSWCVNLSFLE